LLKSICLHISFNYFLPKII